MFIEITSQFEDWNQKQRPNFKWKGDLPISISYHKSEHFIASRSTTLLCSAFWGSYPDTIRDFMLLTYFWCWAMSVAMIRSSTRRSMSSLKEVIWINSRSGAPVARGDLIWCVNASCRLARRMCQTKLSRSSNTRTRDNRRNFIKLIWVDVLTQILD